MVNRDYIIDRLTSKTMTTEEFNFDKLQAPRICDLFTPQDLYQLHYYATSLKLSGRPDIKFEEIDKIMTARGFEQFINGTNRVVYRHLEDRSFLCKVAYNSNSCNDTLSEYRNQFFLKPFVTKVFEVTPDGVLGIIERVNPITSAEEYMSIADDVYIMLNEWFLGSGYVFDDIGSEDFMNTGVRKGFGPVLLDFPYVYPIDRNKIFCVKPDPNSPTGCCEGEIDYDPGFNQLYCSKCGAQYRARELSQAIKDNKVIIKGKESKHMKFTISGGKLNNPKTVVNEENREVKSTPKGKEIKKPNQVQVSFGIPYTEENKAKFAPKPKKADVAPEQTVNGVKEEKIEPVKAESPFDIDEDKKGKGDLGYINEKLVNTIERVLDTFEIDYQDEDDKKRLDSSMLALFNLWINNQSNITKDMIGEIIKLLQDVIENYENENSDEIEEGTFEYPDLTGFGFTFIKELITKSISNKEIDLFVTVDGTRLKPVLSSTLKDGSRLIDIYQGEGITISESANTDFQAPDKDQEVEEEEIVDSEIESTTPYNGVAPFAGEIINVKDIFPTKKPNKVIAIKDATGEYLTVGEDNQLLVIDNLDSRDMNKIVVVSKSWYDEIMNPSTDDVADQEENDVEVKEVSTGVSAPEVSVNGVVDNE